MKAIVVVIALLGVVLGFGAYRNHERKLAVEARIAEQREMERRADSLARLEAAEQARTDALAAAAQRRDSVNRAIADAHRLSKGWQFQPPPTTERKVVVRQYGPTNRRP